MAVDQISAMFSQIKEHAKLLGFEDFSNFYINPHHTGKENGVFLLVLASKIRFCAGKARERSGCFHSQLSPRLPELTGCDHTQSGVLTQCACAPWVPHCVAR